MADIRRAGSDRGDIGAELKNHLISAKIRKEEYGEMIDELEPEELEFDLQEYRTTFEREIKPLYEGAVSMGVGSLVELAEEVRKVYNEIISMIEEKLSDAKR